MNKRWYITCGIVFLSLFLYVGYRIYNHLKDIPSPSASTSMVSDIVSQNVIEITSSGFYPAVMTIKAGDSVTWVNKDNQVHQIDSNPHPIDNAYPPLNSIDLLQPGEYKTLTFPKTGNFGYHDFLHPKIQGIVVVK